MLILQKIFAMNKKSIYKIGKAILGSNAAPSKNNKVAQPKKMYIDNHFRTRNDLNTRTEAEKIACDIFSAFYAKVDGAMQVKESSLPLTTYANCLRTLRLKLENDPVPSQMVSKFWNELTVATNIKTYGSECTRYRYYGYSPNYDYEKTLIFAGLMVVVKLSFPIHDKIDEIVRTIRTVAHAKDNLEYFLPFDKFIKTFNPDEITLSLSSAIKYIKSTSKPYKALALYEFLISNFANDEGITSYIKSMCEGVAMEEPETGTHVDTLNINDGGSMNMIDNSSIQQGNIALENKETKLLEE